MKVDFLRWQQQLYDLYESFRNMYPDESLHSARLWILFRALEVCWLSSDSVLLSKREFSKSLDSCLEFHQQRYCRLFGDSQPLEALWGHLQTSGRFLKFYETLVYCDGQKVHFSQWPPGVLGRWYETAVHWGVASEEVAARRDKMGVHFTPEPLARGLAEAVLKPLLETENREELPRLRFCDPSTGGGAFLLVALELLEVFYLGQKTPETLRQHLVEQCAYGVDLDPLAVEVARLSLYLWTKGTASWQILDEHLKQGHAFWGCWPDFLETTTSTEELSVVEEFPPGQATEWLETWVREQSSDSLPALGAVGGDAFHWAWEFPQVFAEQGGFDAVLANPPFGNAIEQKSSLSSLEKQWSRFLCPEASWGAFDRTAVFLHLIATRLCRPHGRFGMIAPRSLLDGESVNELQRFLFEAARPDALWLLENPRLFSQAHLFLCVLFGARGELPPTLSVQKIRTLEELGSKASQEVVWPATPPESWWALVQGASEHDSLWEMRVLEECCEVYAGCSTEAAYQLSPLVEEAVEDEELEQSSLRLVNTGLVDRFSVLWGEQNVRYLKKRYQKPLWPVLEEAPPAVRRAGERQRRPKLLVGGLTKTLEACLDTDGNWGGVVSTWVILPKEPLRDSLPMLEVLLNSAVVSWLYQQRFGAQQSPWGGMTIRKRGLLQIPLPFEFLQRQNSFDWNSSAIKAPNSPDVSPWKRDVSKEEVEPFLVSVVSALQKARQRGSWSEVGRLDRLVQPWISRMYGCSEEEHEELIRWFEERQRVRGKF